MSTIQEIQLQHHHWVEHNFSGYTTTQPLLGMVEEVGELAHAHLKYEQEIRGYDEATYREEAMDALGDLFIFMCSYANRNNFDLQMCIEHTWARVKRRDWVKFPKDGLTE